VWRIGIRVIAAAAVLLVLWRGAAFVRLAAVALVLAAALESPVSALERRGWRRGLAIAVASLAAAIVLLGAVALLVPRVVPQLERAADAAPRVVSDVQETSQYRWLEEHRLVDRVLSEARRNLGTAAGSALTAAVGVVSFGAAVVTVAALTVFLLASGPSAWSWLLRWVDPSRRPRVRRLGGAARRAVAGYVAGALVMGAIAGLVTGVTTGLLGVPYFLALAIVTAALGIVPFIGAIISGVVVVATTFATAGSTAGVIALIVFVTYQQLEGAVLQPLVQRRAVSMNPLVVISAVLLGTSAGGVLGGVLALPFAAAAKVVANDELKRRRRSWRGPPESALRASAPAAADHH
jgi:predicted PurR-regulated permease PerM